MSTPPLDTRVLESLRATHDALARRGELLSAEQLTASYSAFRAHFGPGKLRALDGPALLQAMHTHGNKESLVYWLEFKNDEEFPGPKLGSIAGGSAFKFRIFRRQDGGEWVAGSAQAERPITQDEAVVIARENRDQLLAGVALLEALPTTAGDDAYAALQNDLARQAPDLVKLGWAHKYWSLLFPEKLDDYHSETWQRHHLRRLLAEPPAIEGLYACAGRFVRLAAHFAWPMNQLTATLNARNGSPVRYWRIGTEVREGNVWPEMRDGRYAAIGFEAMGDIGALPVPKGGRLREVIREKLSHIYYPDNPALASRKAGEAANFVQQIAEDDIVLAADGMRILGVGRVTGPYRYETTPPQSAPHRREVDWVSTKEWEEPAREGLQTTVCELRKPENLLATERALLEKENPVVPVSTSPPLVSFRLEGIPGRIQTILDRKGQAIVYGPPGTGKTFWSRKAALELAALDAFGKEFAKLDPRERDAVQGTAGTPGFVRCCTFHPAYGYEDFIEGFRPRESASGQLVFTHGAGIFKLLCDDARRSSRKFFLLIDEINRGDIPRIFGELLTLLENDKRGMEVILPLSGDCFSVPPNVHVLGTMNTADRSIALLDTALRRRFGFVELMPDASVLGNASAGASIPLGPWLAALNDRLRAQLGRDARNLQIGHAYLLEGSKPVTDFVRFVRVLAEDIVPLLEEYCYEDYGALVRILGRSLVDEERQRIREELFASSRHAELIQALLEPAPEIVTSPDAASATEELEEMEKDQESLA